MPFAQHGDMRADDPPAFGKTHPALRLPSRCRCPDPLEFGVGGCEIRPETGDDRFQQAARRRSADPRRPERLDRRDTVEILAGADPHGELRRPEQRSEEHTSELQSLMRISDAVFCLKKKKKK